MWFWVRLNAPGEHLRLGFDSLTVGSIPSGLTNLTSFGWFRTVSHQARRDSPSARRERARFLSAISPRFGAVEHPRSAQVPVHLQCVVQPHGHCLRVWLFPRGTTNYRQPFIRCHHSFHANATVGKADRWWLASASRSVPSTVSPQVRHPNASTRCRPPSDRPLVRQSRRGQ